MALNRRLCFAAHEPWVMMAYEMIFLILILLSREMRRHSRSLQMFCQTESAPVGSKLLIPPEGIRNPEE